MHKVRFSAGRNAYASGVSLLQAESILHSAAATETNYAPPATVLCTCHTLYVSCYAVCSSLLHFNFPLPLFCCSERVLQLESTRSRRIYLAIIIGFQI